MTTTTDLTYLNPKMLADITGAPINTVHSWRKRRDSNGMPDPDMIAGRVPLWKPDTILPWLHATNRVRR